MHTSLLHLLATPRFPTSASDSGRPFVGRSGRLDPSVSSIARARGIPPSAATCMSQPSSTGTRAPRLASSDDAHPRGSRTAWASRCGCSSTASVGSAQPIPGHLLHPRRRGAGARRPHPSPRRRRRLNRSGLGTTISLRTRVVCVCCMSPLGHVPPQVSGLLTFVILRRYQRTHG